MIEWKPTENGERLRQTYSRTVLTPNRERSSMPFDFLRYWRTAEDSGPIKNGRKTMQRHNSQRDKAPNWRSATKMISHALRSFHGYFIPHTALECFFDVCAFSLVFESPSTWYRNMQMSRDEISLPLPFLSSFLTLALTSRPDFSCSSYPPEEWEVTRVLDCSSAPNNADVSIYKRLETVIHAAAFWRSLRICRQITECYWNATNDNFSKLKKLRRPSWRI